MSSAPQPQLQRRFSYGLVAGCVVVPLLIVAFVVGWVIGGGASQRRVNQIVAMSWQDAANGPAFYGARVFLEPNAGGYSVKALVHIGRGDDYVNYYHDCGELGTVKTPEEAVARWGQIEWRKDGLHIGKGADSYFLPRAEMERGR